MLESSSISLDLDIVLGSATGRAPAAIRLRRRPDPCRPRFPPRTEPRVFRRRAPFPEPVEQPHPPPRSRVPGGSVANPDSRRPVEFCWASGPVSSRSPTAVKSLSESGPVGGMRVWRSPCSTRRPHPGEGVGHVTLAVVNNKGGVGKTTTSVNLAAALAAPRRRVLLVDLDSPASASRWCGVERSRPKPSSASCLLLLIGWRRTSGRAARRQRAQLVARWSTPSPTLTSI